MALNKETFAATARDRMREARDFLHNWRFEARDCYAFVSGRQWLPEDEAHLMEQRRPPITFNYSEKMVDAVVGAEVANRQEATYHPRGVEDSGQADLWNNAAKWIREECGAEDEESDAFRDMLVCGLGWTQTRIDHEEDLDGKLLVERIDPLEMWFDPACSKLGLTDRRYAFREWWTDEREAKARWPGAIFLAVDDAQDAAGGVVTRGHRYEENGDDTANQHKDEVRITHYECVEHEPVYRIVLGGAIKEMSVAQFNSIRDVLDGLGAQYIKQTKRVYYQAYFSGETLLEAGPSLCQEGFTYQAITGKRDRNRNTWYGLTRVMQDPQRWANKWLSQILHIINSNAKGGLMAEVNAFVDPKRAQDEWAQPDSITLFKEGALSGNRVQQKQMAGFPAGLDKLMQFALGSLPMVTGINLEALGLANREQAGVLEAQRKQAAYGLLAPLFDALRRYRKSQGRIVLHMIQTYLSDGRLIRIGGPESARYVPLLRQPESIRYDVVVDQSPSAPDVKTRTWETLMQLVPALLKAGVPIPPDLLDFAPLPVALATRWKAFAAQSSQPDPRTQQLMAELAKLKEENAGLKQDKSIEQAELAQNEQKTVAELTLKKQQQEAELALKRQLAEDEFQLELRKLEQQMELERRKCANDMRIAQEKASAMIAIERSKPRPTTANT